MNSFSSGALRPEGRARANRGQRDEPRKIKRKEWMHAQTSSTQPVKARNKAEKLKKGQQATAQGESDQSGQP